MSRGVVEPAERDRLIVSARRRLRIAFWITAVGVVLALLPRIFPWDSTSPPLWPWVLMIAVPPFFFPGFLFPVALAWIAPSALLLRRGGVGGVIGGLVLLVHFLCERLLAAMFFQADGAANRWAIAAFGASFFLYLALFIGSIRDAAALRRARSQPPATTA